MERGYSYRHWENYLHLGFCTDDIAALLDILCDKSLLDAYLESDLGWAPLHAWRVLAQLKSTEAIEPIFKLSAQYPHNDFMISELPVALSMIGQPARSAVVEALLGGNAAEGQKKLAAAALGEMALRQPEQRGDVIEVFRQYLQSPDPDSPVHNGLLVCHLLDLKAIELLDELRAFYKNDYADISITGDIEDVEIELGVRKTRTTPKPKLDFLDWENFDALKKIINEQVIRTGRAPAARRPETFLRDAPKIGRNESCPCGSGKKHKRCCLNT